MGLRVDVLGVSFILSEGRSGRGTGSGGVGGWAAGVGMEVGGGVEGGWVLQESTDVKLFS